MVAQNLEAIENLTLALCKRQQARRQGGGVHTPPRSQKGPLDRIVKDLKSEKNNVVMVGLSISMHFQQFENLKFLFFPGEHVPGPPKIPWRVSNYPEVGGIVPILLENPGSTSVGTQILQFWRTALTSERAEKYIFVKLS